MKRTLILLIALILLGVLAWKLNTDNKGSTLKKELAGFAISDTAQVSRIFIAKSDGSQVDLKRAGKIWTINDKYQAKKVNVDLLLKCFKRIEVRGPVPGATRKTVIKTMAAKATKVEIYLGGGKKPAKTWYVGTSDQDHRGTYMLLETLEDGRSTAPFLMGMSGFTGFLTPRFHTSLEDWRNSKLIGIADLTSIVSYTVQNNALPKESFTIRHQESTFELLDGDGQVVSTPDTAQVAGTLVPLKKLHYEFFEDFFDAERRDSVMQSQPLYEVLIRLNDGTEQQVNFWKRKPPTARYDDEGSELPIDPDRMFSVVNETELVVVQRHLFDRALPRLNDLR